jgi:ubiquinone/menaquinone biosynthesis C-methylase UbiE
MERRVGIPAAGAPRDTGAVGTRGTDVSETWRLDHPWASIYAFGIARPALAAAVGRLAFGTGFQGLYAAIDSIASVPPGGTVLDVPCGGGVALRGIRPGSDVRYVAADISPAMLRRTERVARRLGVVVETLAADVAHLPLDDLCADLCLSLTGLHCFPDPAAAVVELARVTRDRIELTWLRSDAGPRYQPLLASGRAAGLIGPSATPDEVTAWLEAAGFTPLLTVEGAFAYVTARRTG